MPLPTSPTPAPEGEIRVSDKAMEVLTSERLDPLDASPEFLAILEELVTNGQFTYWLLVPTPSTGEQEPRELVGIYAAKELERRGVITNEEQIAYLNAFDRACKKADVTIDDIQVGIDAREEARISPPGYIAIPKTTTTQRLEALIETAERTGAFWVVEEVDLTPGEGNYKNLSRPDGTSLI